VLGGVETPRAAMPSCRRAALAGGDQLQFEQLKRREFMTGL